MYYYNWVGDFCGIEGLRGVKELFTPNTLDCTFLAETTDLNFSMMENYAASTPYDCDYDAYSYMTPTSQIPSDPGNYSTHEYGQYRSSDFASMTVGQCYTFRLTVGQDFYGMSGSWEKGDVANGAIFIQTVIQEDVSSTQTVIDYNTAYDTGQIIYDLEANWDWDDTLGIQLGQVVTQGYGFGVLDEYVVLAQGDQTAGFSYKFPIHHQLKEEFFCFVACLNGTNTLHLAKYDFSTDTISSVDTLVVDMHLTLSDDVWITNGLLAFQPSTDELFVGDPTYTGSKPEQGRVQVIDIDFTNETLTHQTYIEIPTPGRYSQFGCSIDVDTGSSGSGVIVVGCVGEEEIYTFNGTTFAQISTGTIVVGQNAGGGALCCHNNELMYAYEDGNDYIECMMAFWSGTAWTGTIGSTGKRISGYTATMLGVLIKGFSNDSTYGERPQMCVQHPTSTGYSTTAWGVYGSQNRAHQLNSWLPAVQADNGQLWWNWYETVYGRLVDDDSLWYNNSYTEPFTELPDTQGDLWRALCPLSNPLDSNDCRLIQLFHGEGATGPDVYHTILNIGMQSITAFKDGNFYCIDKINCSNWSSISTVSLVGGGQYQGDTGDALRFMWSFDEGDTWTSTESNGATTKSIASIAAGFTDAELTTYITGLRHAAVGSASEIWVCYLFTSSDTSPFDSPYFQGVTLTYLPVPLGDPEFVLNYETNSSVEKMEFDPVTYYGTTHVTIKDGMDPTNVVLVWSRDADYEATANYG